MERRKLQRVCVGSIVAPRVADQELQSCAEVPVERVKEHLSRWSIENELASGQELRCLTPVLKHRPNGLSGLAWSPTRHRALAVRGR
jgi:hypothetical protein